MIENLILDSSLLEINDFIACMTSRHNLPCLFIPSLDILSNDSKISSLAN